MDPTVGVHHVGGHAVPHNAVNWVAWVNLFQICLFFSEHQHTSTQYIKEQLKFNTNPCIALRWPESRRWAGWWRSPGSDNFTSFFLANAPCNAAWRHCCQCRVCQAWSAPSHHPTEKTLLSCRTFSCHKECQKECTEYPKYPILRSWLKLIKNLKSFYFPFHIHQNRLGGGGGGHKWEYLPWKYKHGNLWKMAVMLKRLWAKLIWAETLQRKQYHRYRTQPNIRSMRSFFFYVVLGFLWLFYSTNNFQLWSQFEL